MNDRYSPTLFPTESALQPAGLLHTRGIAGSGLPHCPIFPTAASRRSLGRVSVPVWLIILSEQLPIVALVGLYPTNKLIGHRLIPQRVPRKTRFHPQIVCGISPSFLGLSPTAR